MRDDRVEQGGQRLLALEQRDCREVVVVEVEEIEGEERQLVRAPLGERVLERRKAAVAALVLDQDLAVDQRLPAGQRREGLGERAVAVGPVEAGAGDQPGRAALDPGERAIAVELDLVQPVGARGRRARRRGELGAQLGRQRAPSWRPAARRA